MLWCFFENLKCISYKCQTLKKISLLNSVPSKDNLYNLHKRLQQIFISEELFGGRSLLLVGDIMQLGPVRAPAIYREPRLTESKALFLCNEYNLWNNCQSIFLEQNYRQGHKCLIE